MQSIVFLRPKEVFAARGRPRTCTYDDIKDGLLPPFVKLGPRASGLPAHELAAVNAAKLSGATDDELRTLVRKLVRQRKAAA